MASTVTTPAPPKSTPQKNDDRRTSRVLQHAPVSGWRRMLTDWRTVGGATVVCHVIGAATSLLLRMILDPAQMGIWQTLKLLLNYGNYANLGISKGALREFTIALGRGATENASGKNAADSLGSLANARRGLNLAFTVNTLTSLVYATVLVGVGVYLGSVGDGQWSSGWAVGMCAIGLLAVLSRYFTFHVTILRSTQSFNVTSRLSILEGLLTLGICTICTWLWGLRGLYLGTLFVILGSLAFVLRHKTVTLSWAWDASEIRRLIAIGGPILLAGTVASLFRSLDKLMILGYFSEREYQLGCYSVALLVTVQLYGLGEVLAIVMGPRYGEKFGHCGERKLVAQMAARATELQAALMTLPAGLAVVAAAPLLGWLLPKYQAGLAPLVWLVPGALALTITLPASQYLVAVNRQRRALAVVCVATILGGVGNHWALTAGYGLVGVAMATAVSYLLYFLLTLAVSIWPELPASLQLRYVSMLAIVLFPTMATALYLELHWPSSQASWDVVFIKCLAVSAVWAATTVTAWRVGGWHRAK